MQVFEIFLRCKCGRLKNANYTAKKPTAKADCVCGIKQTKEIKVCRKK